MVHTLSILHNPGRGIENRIGHHMNVALYQLGKCLRQLHHLMIVNKRQIEHARSFSAGATNRYLHRQLFIIDLWIFRLQLAPQPGRALENINAMRHEELEVGVGLHKDSQVRYSSSSE